MNDLISRQAAIELAMQYCTDDDGSCSKADRDIRELLDDLENLPSAQPTQSNASNALKTLDCIDRQAAIDAINNAFDRETLLNGFVRSIAVRAIRDMPSAQPEIIRCKDCRWHNGEINQCNAQICASMYGEDFCSKGERREE